MRRRNFILGGGLLATLSLGATATNASLADSVAAAADFRVIPEEADTTADISIETTTEFFETQHTWDGMDFTSAGQDIDEIVADYGDAANFDDDGGFNSVTDITVEFAQEVGGSGQFRLEDVGSDLDISNAATATFENLNEEIEDSSTDTNVNIEIEGFENPESGSYEPTLTFVRQDGEEFTTGGASFQTSTGTGEFIVTITEAPDSIGFGSPVTVEAEIENVSDEGGQQGIELTVDEESQDADDSSKLLSLQGEETDDLTLESDPIQSGSEIDISVASDDDQDTVEGIEVIGGWNLEIDPDEQEDPSEHTWSTDLTVFDGDIDAITVDYPSEMDFDGLDESDITVQFSPKDSDNLQDINLVSETYSGSEATFDLDDDDTTLDGEAEVIIDGIENPEAGEYDADITLTGSNDSISATASFEVIDGRGPGGGGPPGQN